MADLCDGGLIRDEDPLQVYSLVARKQRRLVQVNTTWSRLVQWRIQGAKWRQFNGMVLIESWDGARHANYPHKSHASHPTPRRRQKNFILATPLPRSSSAADVCSSTAQHLSPLHCMLALGKVQGRKHGTSYRSCRVYAGYTVCI